MMFRSQTEVVNTGQKLRGVSGWLGFSEVYYEVRARTWIYRVRKWSQQTTAVPTSSLATSASQLLIRITGVVRLLAYPQADTPRKALSEN